MNFADTKWLEPWHPIDDVSGVDIRAVLAEELYNEVGQGHVLRGIKVYPIARRSDCDDVLFQLLDGRGRFAVVHLAYSVQSDPKWPATTIYNSWTEFLQRMSEDAAGSKK